MPRKITQEDFENRLKEIHGDKYTIIGKYTKRINKIETKCNVCGNVWNPRGHDLLQGSGCPKCAGNILKTQEQFLEEFKKVHNGEIECLGEYINKRTKLSFKHIVCEHIWEASPENILRGTDCPKCARVIRNQKQTKTYEKFLKELKEIHGDEIECLEEYINSHTPISFKHIVCGHIWKAAPQDILRGTGCPKCASSKGEKYIQQILEKYNINFKTQYKISECKNINPLPFDFAVFDDNDNLLFLIEYDGELHFKSVDYFGGEEHLERQQLHDKIKDDYCEDNNIPLERIAYFDWGTEEDIEKIVVEMFRKYGLI